MVKQRQNLLDRRSAFATLAITLGIFGVTASPVRSLPSQQQNSFELAQVGVRSRIDRPTPLNLRPRTHIPLPRGRYEGRSDYYGYPGYRGRRDDRYRYDRHRTYRRHRHHHRTGPVIIINPSNYSEYSNYDSYIRIIGK